MTKSKRRGPHIPSPENRREHSFLHPQETGAVWVYLPLWLLVAFVLRAAVALSGDFLLHPDELMQYLEPAHRLVFGNGIVFWEYFYGARSWLVPGVIAGVLWLCSLIGLDSPQYYVAAVKLVFCALSLVIPWGMYLFCRRHWGESSARLALVLGVVWYELVGFAHKPMTEFVATALLCVLLAIMPLHAPSRAWRGWAVAGAVGMMAVAVRFQYAPLIGMILLVGLYRAHARERLAMIGGGAMVVCAVGALETWTWGMPFHSYWFNAVFNFVYNRFRMEESSLWLIPWQLLHASCGLFAVAVASLVGNVRRRGFVFVLLLLVVIPHMLSTHREYRHVFAAVPLWLMVFADVVAMAGQRLTASGALRQTRLLDALGLRHGDNRGAPAGALVSLAGVGVAVLVSTAGIVNAIPYQNNIYISFSGERRYVNFLHDHNPSFQLYRRLSDDDSVHGVLDASRTYLGSGGYYYLHRSIPFYDYHLWGKIGGGSNPARYASHIITRASAGGGNRATVQDKTGGKTWVLETDYGYELLPFFIGDPDSGELVYWSKNARRMPRPGYTMVEQVDDLILWQSRIAQPLKQWRDHSIIIHPGPPHLQSLQYIFGKHAIRTPPPDYGVEFTDD